MIKLIYGAKGSGKTNLIISDANNYVGECDGEVVFLTDTDKYMHKVNYKIRLININDYDVRTELGLSGFVRGIVACNHDVKRIYIDGIHRMTNKSLPELQNSFEALSNHSEKYNIDFVLTASTDVLPEFMNKFEKVKA